MSESPSGPTQHHQPEKAGGPNTKGMFNGKYKWYLIGGVAVIAVLVFVFVKKSNTNATTSTTGATSSSLDPTTESALQSALQAVSAGQFSGSSGAAGTTNNYYSGTTSPSGPTSTGGSAASNPLTISLPNAGGQSWESVVFPNQGAYDSWTQWNQGFVNNNNAQATRTQWNNELNSLGVTGVNGAALTPPNSASPNPYDRQ